MDPLYSAEYGGRLANPIHNVLLRAIKANKVQAIYGQFQKSGLKRIKTMTGRNKYKWSKHFDNTKVFLYAHPIDLVVIGDVEYLSKIFKKYKSFKVCE